MTRKLTTWPNGHGVDLEMNCPLCGKSCWFEIELPIDDDRELLECTGCRHKWEEEV